MRLPRLLLPLALIALFGQAPAWATPRVVTSIKPVHSLVSMISRDVFDPILLMSTSQSPHHYSLKPSERRLLEQAELVFWIGPGMESFMPRLVESLDKKTIAVPLIETSGLALLDIRVPDGHTDDHDQQHQQTRHDPHIWLNTSNVEIMANEITRRLVKIDPENITTYEFNLGKLKQHIGELRQRLHQLLANKKLPFLTYHDAYQYFEEEFGLNNAGFVSTGADLQPGAGHIMQLKVVMKQNNIQCVFYEAPFKPPIIKSLLAGTNAEAVQLDATGLLQVAGSDNLFLTMLSLGENISTCLQSGR